MHSLRPKGPNRTPFTTTGAKDLPTQLAISLTFGIGAFIAFCILRPRWSTLYAARKKQVYSASALPDLPKSLFGWIPALWKITDDEVLATAGLDAYVFLAFFKMAIRFTGLATILAFTVLLPIQYYYDGSKIKFTSFPMWALSNNRNLDEGKPKKLDGPYLWAYLFFVYIFTGLATYLLVDATKKVIAVRQKYLGGQVTITDRTIRLSGVPPELQSENALRQYIDELNIGKVESVTICRDWLELDKLMEQRDSALRSLEAAYTSYYGFRRTLYSDPDELPTATSTPSSTDSEHAPLLAQHESGPHSHKTNRPMHMLRYGPLKMHTKTVDSIDHYTALLQTLDEKVIDARKQTYKPVPIAFVTMSSTASAQVAIQAVLDPRFGTLLAYQAPAPDSIVWRNTYMSRTQRVVRSWSISVFVSILSIIWLIPVTGLAALLNIADIQKIWPWLAAVLEKSEWVESLVQAFLPTLALTLLNVAVPYFYEWLSRYQAFISIAELELSVISKNFFFTFFNLFIAFTILGTALTFEKLWDELKGSLSDTTRVAYALASSLNGLAAFYVNLIILQGIGMFPFRLLEFGTVALYPITKLIAKSPRQHAELNRPPVFSYGFFLPQPILVLIITFVYSILPRGRLILFFGFLYFILGYFTYKYQLLYAMDHPQHSTGQAWSMIFYRVVMGLIIFQLAMAGFLASQGAFVRSAMVAPLIVGNVLWMYRWEADWGKLNSFIALHAIREPVEVDVNQSIPDEEGQVLRGDGTTGSGYGRAAYETLDERREHGGLFVNPSLVSPLEDVWVGRRRTMIRRATDERMM
ncbi:hypothetical protein DFP73DRAFT_474108 [Morchella snyderi]|nr:hypothetical protein DFP73DRAFT_474108 [Morchella snyderi]